MTKAAKGVRTVLALSAALLGEAALSPLLAETDIYGNEIKYNGQGEVTYRFWYGSQTAESMSPSDSASATFVMSDTFEPRYRASAVSDGKCHFRGLHIVIR